MQRLGKYDTALQMFVAEQPKDPDPSILAFLKYLVEHGQLEDDVVPAYALVWGE